MLIQILEAHGLPQILLLLIRKAPNSLALLLPLVGRVKDRARSRRSAASRRELQLTLLLLSLLVQVAPFYGAPRFNKTYLFLVVE